MLLQSRTIGWLGVFLLAMAQTACVECTNPLVTPDKAEIDKDLLGAWKSAEPKEKGEGVMVALAKNLKGAPAGLLELSGLEKNGKDKQYAFATKLGNDRYVHLVLPKTGIKELTEWKSADIQGYFICKYTIADQRWTLWFMDADETGKLITDGKLKGTAKKGPFGPDVKLQESTEGIRKFLEASSKLVYTDKNKLVLVKK